MAKDNREDAARTHRVKKTLRMIAAAGVVLLAAGVIWFLLRNRWELYRIFTSDDPAAAMDRFLDGNRLLGAVILLAVQVIQIILAFIPGGPMQMVAGALYGGLLGGVILLAGSAIAAFIVWWMVNWLDRKSVV